MGLAKDHSCALPITQGKFADGQGLPTVHINRVFQKLRAKGLIVLKGSTLTVPDWEKLKLVGDFDVTYLQMETQEVAFPIVWSA